MFLHGKNSVLERLKANPLSIKKVFLQYDFKEQEIISLIKENNIPIFNLRRNELHKIKHLDNPQGIIADVDKFSYTPFKDLLVSAKENKLSLIFLDGVTDPQNLGSIIRTAACFGGFGIVIHRYNACDVNDTVLHVANGGENFVQISMVPNISTSLIEAKNEGFWIAGAVVEGGEDLDKAELLFPIAIVLGSESIGIRHGVQKQLDLKLNIPMHGAGLSFNVGSSCAIFCYEIARQRR